MVKSDDGIVTIIPPCVFGLFQHIVAFLHIVFGSLVYCCY